MSTIKRTCSIEGCDRPHDSHGFCGMHHMRWRNHGDPLRERPTAEDRFWAKVDKRGPDECWPWTGRVDRATGYGCFSVKYRAFGAHRFAYELLVGPIPEGLVIDHLCRNRACVNPAHMEPVTNRENILRGEGVAAINKAKTHRIRGHPFDAANTHVRNGWRSCRECRRLRQGLA